MTALELRNERKKRELTQKRLSEIVGYCLRTIQKWEGSERKMSKWADYDVRHNLELYDKGKL